ncbi:GNAT family N-acetyltransferase [Mycobacterium sp. CBMA293]|uniref:GNAT family N-acetyltransferase n=2 Tax=Mycolicibacterium TaxID=1866885 RepID=UPI0013209BB6|nr:MULTISPECIES: GNAT family N-acetyltransferase [unclassified Mycolicibacterium]MUL44786.1 GNAT family N-acetyltransferase [Mycolicibacterium sp. CBMA 360]MUL95379.1 GNAT family N-acetyltransferase [Mycolicibacterium sp. CBMA 230]MUL58105.1 GNAT family N-acetyltransferase [Mycolicibacterium sp. CBMA 335]MUL73563.1 GNAT family N-acetyltransferase [Mycolicibacterium sp. CBMA 311]MUM09831.1 GNAT family N-acetyltransferase [Mycolicibacterium sp. CBMA 293]
MPNFSPVITDYWRAAFGGEPLHSNEYLTTTVNPDLDHDDRVAVLWTADDDRISIAISPAVALALTKNVAVLANSTETNIRAALTTQGVVLNGADNVFYLTESVADDILGDTAPTNVRQLIDADGDMFAAFKATVSEEDWDGAYVELDHWAVFGAFDEHERLVSIGSMYPWDDEFPLADVGVLTPSSVRGRGHAKTLVRAMFRHALNEGYEPQYRCQLDNAASIQLAASLGLRLFGRWETVMPDDE